MAKKRRTELDIDPAIVAEPPSQPEKEEAPPPPQAEPTPSEQPAPPGPPAEEETPPKRKVNYLKLLTLVALGSLLLVVAMALGAGVMMFLLSGSEEPAKKKAAPTATERTPAPEKKKAAPKIPAPPLYQLKPFLVQIGDGKEKSLVRVGFAAEMSRPEVSKEIERNLILIRENIYFILRRKSIDDFMDLEKRRKMAVEVAIALNRSIQSGAVNKVYVTDLTVQ